MVAKGKSKKMVKKGNPFPCFFSFHSAGVLLHTNSFSKEEVQLLQKVLLSKYGLITTLTTKISKSTHNKTYIIYVWKKSLPDFIAILKSYVIPSMLYKLRL